MTRPAILLVAILASRCTPSPVPGPSPTPMADAAPTPAVDASAQLGCPLAGSDVAGAVCCHLEAIGCADGRSTNCRATVAHVIAERLTPLDPDRILAARTIDEARAAGARCAVDAGL